MKRIFFILSMVALVSRNNLYAQIDTTSIAGEFEKAESRFSPPISIDKAGNDRAVAGTRFVLAENVFSLPGKGLPMPAFPGNIDYLKKSRRQKTTGWILLGTGTALIITGIAGAYSADDDPITAAVSLVFLSGPGIVTSLISIPFFVASKRNKRRAMAVSSSIGCLPAPQGIAGIIMNKRYPALAMKMSF